MQDQYEIQTLEQLRTIADPLRVRIIDTLQDQPMTVTQIGDVLELAPAKVHYHVRELEKVGLVQLVETREKGGILEKYYQPVARDFSVSKQLLISAPPDESLATINVWFDQFKSGFQQAFRKALEQKELPLNFGLGSAIVYVTAEEQEQLTKQMLELLKPYERRRNKEDEQAIVNALISYPQPALPLVDQPSYAETEKKPIEQHWTVGSVPFGRTQLEKLRTENQRISINVTGICSFEHDVSPELVDQVVEHFHLVGKLKASTAVREVLKRKQG